MEGCKSDPVALPLPIRYSASIQRLEKQLEMDDFLKMSANFVKKQNSMV
jgi:hypothetical protein